jgi:hypothetical protein
LVLRAFLLVENFQQLLDRIHVDRIGLDDERIEAWVGRDAQRAARFDGAAAHAEQRADDAAAGVAHHGAGQIAEQIAAAVALLDRAAAENLIERLGHHVGFRVFQIEYRVVRTAVHRVARQGSEQPLEFVQGLRIFRSDHHAVGTDGNDDQRGSCRAEGSAKGFGISFGSAGASSSR